MDQKKRSDLQKNLVPFIVSIALLFYPMMGAHAEESSIRDPEISCAGQDHNICQVEEAVNIRTSPTTQSRIVKKLHRGDRVKTGSLENYWYSVFNTDQNADNDARAIGYVYAPLLKPAGKKANAGSSLSRGPGAKPSCVGQEHNICQVHGTVNIRTSPDVRSRIVKKLYPNDRVKTGTLKNGWYSVFNTDQNADNDARAIGYVYAPLLKPVKEMISKKPAAQEPTAQEPEAQEPADEKLETQSPKASIDALKKKIASLEEEVLYMGERLDETELHTATDRLSFDFELRTRVDSIHYTDMRRAPQWFLDAFIRDGSDFRSFSSTATTLEESKAFWVLLKEALKSKMPPGMDLIKFILSIKGFGFDGLPTDFAILLRRAMQEAGDIPKSETYNVDDGTIWTNKFFMNMKAKITSNLSFTGRLAMYKVFGDSSGLKINNGSFGDIFLDSNTSSLPHGDSIRLERAYFNYKSTIGNLPINLSLGRRPATNGPPLEYANNSLEGGSPVASLINMQFDGISLNFSLEDATNIPGAAFKLCYGVGFESGWGNTFSLAHDSDDVRDATFGGFIATLYNDDTTSLVLNYAHAWNLTDGFTGVMVLPFLVSKTEEPIYDGKGLEVDKEWVTHIKENTADLVSRMEGNINIGDVDMLGLLLRTNTSAIYEDMDIDLFLSLSWSHTDPSDLSTHPFYSLLGYGMLTTDSLEKHDGYSIYMGAVFPAFEDDRIGFEFNWGSKYWFNMTSAEDSLVASKLSARGMVFEGYYIKPIVGRNMFVTVGARYYDYKYTLSGNPLGEPVEISEADGIQAVFPTPDKVWDFYTSVTVRY